MPPSARKPVAKKPAEVEKAEARHAKADGEICRLCWPGGWPTDDTHSASCIHGAWTR